MVRKVFHPTAPLRNGDVKALQSKNVQVKIINNNSDDKNNDNDDYNNNNDNNKPTREANTKREHPTTTQNKGLPHTPARLTAAALTSRGENERESGALRPAARRRPHPAAGPEGALPGRLPSLPHPRGGGGKPPPHRTAPEPRAGLSLRGVAANPPGHGLSSSRPVPSYLSTTTAHLPGNAGPSGAAGNKFSPHPEEKPLPRHRGSSPPPPLPPSGPGGGKRAGPAQLPSPTAASSPAPARNKARRSRAGAEVRPPRWSGGSAPDVARRGAGLRERQLNGRGAGLKERQLNGCNGRGARGGAPRRVSVVTALPALQLRPEEAL